MIPLSLPEIQKAVKNPVQCKYSYKLEQISIQVQWRFLVNTAKN